MTVRVGVGCCYYFMGTFSGRFTSKPKRGVKFLQEKGLIGKTSEEVAKFFHSDVRLDRTAVGDYLGEGDE